MPSSIVKTDDSFAGSRSEIDFHIVDCCSDRDHTAFRFAGIVNASVCCCCWPPCCGAGTSFPVNVYRRFDAHWYEITVAVSVKMIRNSDVQNPIVLCQLKFRAFLEIHGYDHLKIIIEPDQGI